MTTREDELQNAIDDAEARLLIALGDMDAACAGASNARGRLQAQTNVEAARRDLNRAIDAARRYAAGETP